MHKSIINLVGQRNWNVGLFSRIENLALAVRDTSVSRHNGGPIKPLNTIVL